MLSLYIILRLHFPSLQSGSPGPGLKTWTIQGPTKFQLNCSWYWILIGVLGKIFEIHRILRLRSNYCCPNFQSANRTFSKSKKKQSIFFLFLNNFWMASQEKTWYWFQFWKIFWSTLKRVKNSEQTYISKVLRWNDSQWVNRCSTQPMSIKYFWLRQFQFRSNLFLHSEFEKPILREKCQWKRRNYFPFGIA